MRVSYSCTCDLIASVPVDTRIEALAWSPKQPTLSTSSSQSAYCFALAGSDASVQIGSIPSSVAAAVHQKAHLEPVSSAKLTACVNSMTFTSNGQFLVTVTGKFFSCAAILSLRLSFG